MLQNTMLEITDFCPKLRFFSILITDFNFQRLAALFKGSCLKIPLFCWKFPFFAIMIPFFGCTRLAALLRGDGPGSGKGVGVKVKTCRACWDEAEEVETGVIGAKN